MFGDKIREKILKLERKTMDVIFSALFLSILVFMNHVFLVRGQSFKGGKLNSIFSSPPFLLKQNLNY